MPENIRELARRVVEANEDYSSKQAECMRLQGITNLAGKEAQRRGGQLCAALALPMGYITDGAITNLARLLLHCPDESKE